MGWERERSQVVGTTSLWSWMDFTHRVLNDFSLSLGHTFSINTSSSKTLSLSLFLNISSHSVYPTLQQHENAVPLFSRSKRSNFGLGKAWLERKKERKKKQKHLCWVFSSPSKQSWASNVDWESRTTVKAFVRFIWKDFSTTSAVAATNQQVCLKGNESYSLGRIITWNCVLFWPQNCMKLNWIQQVPTYVDLLYRQQNRKVTTDWFKTRLRDYFGMVQCVAFYEAQTWPTPSLIINKIINVQFSLVKNRWKIISRCLFQS